MALISATVPIPHGVVFVYNPTMIIDIPTDTGAAPVLATPTCVSVWTLHDVDGPTTLVLADSCDGDDCEVVFRGSLVADGRRIAINNSSCEQLLQIDLSSPRPEITIYADDMTNPTKLVCTTC